MFFNRLFRSKKSPPDSAQRPHRAVRLSVEALEDRIVPTAMLTIDNATVLEGNNGTHNIAVTVRLTAPHSNTVTVDYRTADGTALAGTDYNAASGKLTFARNELSKTILVPVIGDRVPEPDRDFLVRISNPKGAKIADGEGIVTIADDEPRIIIHDVSGEEGTSGTTPFTFRVELTTAYDLPVTINYTTADGTAIAGIDFTAAAGTLTFDPGQGTQTITVLVNGDRLAEPDKNFFVNLTTPDSYAALSRSTAAGIIADSSPRISISDAFWNYGDPTITFTVLLSAAYDQEVTVNFATVDGTALAGVDYVATSGTLTFAPGETYKTITVDVIYPASYPDGYFYVHLSDASTNALIANEWATGYWYYYGDGYDYGYYDGGW